MEVEQQQRLVMIRILKETYNEACRGRRWKTTSRDQKLAYLPLVLDSLTESSESSIVMTREQVQEVLEVLEARHPMTESNAVLHFIAMMRKTRTPQPLSHIWKLSIATSAVSEHKRCHISPWFSLPVTESPN